jgi:hypothetical protein
MNWNNGIYRGAHGAIYYNGHQFVDAHKPRYGTRATVDAAIKVRERTSDEWWIRAAEIKRYGEDTFCAGVTELRTYVDFLLSDHGGHLVPDEVRFEMEREAAEAAREAIVTMLHEHEQVMFRTLHQLFPVRK